MSTLSHKDIIDRLKDPKSGLAITPILHPRQIGAMSVDLRLGNQFIVFRMHTAGAYNQTTFSRGKLHRVQQRQIVRFGKTFVLHPGTMALGGTFEYIKLPEGLEGQVEGRSSWARVGLQIAAASSIEPGFRGIVTLELANVGTMPLELFPGSRIAQLVLRTMSSSEMGAYGKGRKYRCVVAPEFSRLDGDRDAKAFFSSPPVPS